MAEATGTSNKGDLQEAISVALASAQQATPGADMLIKWQLEGIAGEHGGIVGKNELTATISYRS